MKRIFFGILTIFTAGFVVFGITQAFFSDNETSFDNTITTASSFNREEPAGGTESLVINEVYYDPDEDHEVEGGPIDSEWVEIYNPTDSTVNLKDWKIADSITERVISSTDRNLGPGEFVILARADDVRAIWGIAVEKFIPIGARIGSGLNNEGDSVILKNNEGSVVDQLSYGDDTTILDPSIPDAADGHSIERDPDGVDTDSPADFVDRETPQPGS